MTLAEFVKSTPSNLRIGQHFVNTYWKGSDETSQALYQLDSFAAVAAIQHLMDEWQWENLPDIKGGDNE